MTTSNGVERYGNPSIALLVKRLMFDDSCGNSRQMVIMVNTGKNADAAAAIALTNDE
jgi:hypothetical protein